MIRIVLRFLVLMVAAASTVACDPGPPTGSAALRITFADPPADHDGLRHLMSGIVDRIRVRVDSNGVQLVDNVVFDYEDEQGNHEPGIVEDIPTGEDRRFVVEALAPDDTVVFDDQVEGVTIVANRTVDVPIELDQAFDDPDDVYPPAPVYEFGAVADVVDVVLTWRATGDDWMIDPATSYDIRWSESTIQTDTFESATVITEGVPTPGNPTDLETFRVTGLAPSRTYHFAMKVIDNNDNKSDLSDDVEATTEDRDETAPATITSLTAPEVTETSVTLQWIAPADDGGFVASGSVDSYDVRWADVPIVDDPSWEAATRCLWPPATAIVEPGVFQRLEVTELTPDQVYYFAVKACDEVEVPNCSGISNYATGIPHDFIPPAAVELIVFEVTDDSVTLYWTAPGDDGNEAGYAAASYDIRYSENPITTIDNFYNAIQWDFPFDPQLAGATESVTIAPLDFLKTYYFAMISYDEVDNPSPLSNNPNATPGTQDVTPPAAVADLAVELETETVVVLSWTAPGDDGTAGDPVFAYDVRYAGVHIGDEATWILAALLGGPSGADIVAAGGDQTFEVNVLTVGLTYHFAIKSTDNSGNESGLSNSVSGGPRDITSPSDIDDLVVVVADSGDDYVVLEWSAPGDSGVVGQADHYEIYYHTAAFDDRLDANLWDSPLVTGPVGTPETATIDGLTPGSQVFVRIRTADEVPNWSGLSNQVYHELSCVACPVIDLIRPAPAPVDALIWLEGSNFDDVQGLDNKVFIGGLQATVISWSANRIVVRVPAASGAVDLIVTNSIGMLSTPFQVPPYIDALIPDTVTPPQAVTITGTGFGGPVGSSSVQITGMADVSAVDVTLWTDTQIVVEVPAGAGTGPVTVKVDEYASNTPLLTVGAPRTWTPPSIRINDAAPSTSPLLASDSNGDLQLIWVETDGAFLQVFGEARQGGAWQGLFDVSQGVVDSASPRLINAGAGDFRAIWLDGLVSVRAGSGFDVGWSVAEVAAELAGSAVIGVLSDGRMVAAWTAADGLSVRFNIHDGVWGSPQDLLVPTSGNTNSVGGAVDPAGNFHVAFIDGSDLIHYYYNSTDWVGPGVVAAPTATPAGVRVDLASDPKGGVHALWWDNEQYWYSPWDGAVWAVPQQVSAIIGTSSSGWLELVADGAGTLHAVVEDDGGGSDYDIIYFELEPGGWTMGLNLSHNNPDHARAPSLCVTPDLVVNVVWSEVDCIYMSRWE